MVVDLFEVLALFGILGADNFEIKLQFIFQLFDFDGSSTIDINELILTL